MSKLRSALSFLLLVLVCLGEAAFASAQPADSKPADRAVVLVSVDGLANFYFDDPKAEMPTIRQLAAEGARADGMRASTPTVTWPNHTTIVTGVQPARHGVVGNTYFDRNAGKAVTLLTDPVFDKSEIVKVPTIADLAHAAGLKTAGVIWPATRNDKSLDWTVPDCNNDELYQRYATPALLAECREAGLPFEKYEEWCKAGRYDERDKLNTGIFSLIVKRHHPTFAMLHLIDVDHMQHVKGPRTPEAYAAIKGVDAHVREVWDLLKREYPQGRVSLVIVSDHGFQPIRQAILPNVTLRNAGLVEVKGTRVVGGSVRVVTQGGCCFLYVLDKENPDATADRAAAAFKDVEGIAKVVRRGEGFKEYGVADPKVDPHAPDLLLLAKGGYSFGDTSAGELPVTTKSAELRGTHGHDSLDPDLFATFVAWGNGVKSGVKLPRIDNTDVAPTLAALLGVKMENVDGKVLTDVLAK